MHHLYFISPLSCNTNSKKIGGNVHGRWIKIRLSKLLIIKRKKSVIFYKGL